MAIQRVTLIFDHTTRPATTCVYCRRALRGLVEVEHVLPSELYRVPCNGFDLCLNIDDGLDYKLPAELRPSAWWAIDTHINFAWCLDQTSFVGLCVSVSDERHLDFAKTFDHFTFNLLPRFRQAVVVFGSSFRHARFKAIGAIGDTVRGDRL